MANYFSIFLVIITLISGLIWLFDSMILAPKRKEKIAAAQADNENIDEDTIRKIAPLPVPVDVAQQIFPVIAFVLVLRSFLYEPFQIPSGSMMPTLLVGDFILVEKFTYGLKDPVFRKQFVDVGRPKRGDIVVFKYPEDPMVDYIKRVVAEPGDRIMYRSKRIYIQKPCEDGQTCELKPLDLKFENNSEFSLSIPHMGRQYSRPLNKFTESLGELPHQILQDPARPSEEIGYFNQNGTPVNEWIVPEGHYFVLGDNRDNSRDSRFWGFVPEENLVGKAVAIWMSFEFERSDDSFLPGFLPTNVRFSRVGGIH